MHLRFNFIHFVLESSPLVFSAGRLSSFQNVLEFDLNGWNVNISFVFFSFLFCETDFVIHFKKKRNGFQNPFGNF